MNEIENRKIESMKSKFGSLKRFLKIDKPLARLRKEREKGGGEGDLNYQKQMETTNSMWVKSLDCGNRLPKQK